VRETTDGRQARWLAGCGLALVSLAGLVLLGTAPPPVAEPVAPRLEGAGSADLDPPGLPANGSALPDERRLAPERGADTSRPEPLAAKATDPRRGAIEALARGSLAVEVVDARSGQLVPAFRYLLHGPGTATERGETTGGRAVLLVRVGLPVNLRIEADGYVPADRRQIHATKQDPNPSLRIRLAPAR
jgi:hypothetical protein